MRLRPILLALLLVAPFWAAVGWAAAQAAPAPADAQALLERSSARYARQLHVEPLAVTLEVVPTEELVAGPGGAQVPCDRPTVIETDVEGANRYAVNARGGRWWFPGGALQLLHELGHVYSLAVRECPDDLSLEEAAADAAARGLLPAYTRQVLRRGRWDLWNVREEHTAAYATQTTSLLGAARYATGSRGWRSRAALAWVRAFVVAPDRHGMLAQAEAARG